MKCAIEKLGFGDLEILIEKLFLRLRVSAGGDARR